MRANLLLSFFLCTFSILSLDALQFKLQDLGTLSYDNSKVGRINSQGIITGQVMREKKPHNFIWQSGKGLTILDYIPSCDPPFINNHNSLADIFWYYTNYWVFDNEGFKHICLVKPEHKLEDIMFPQGWPIQNLEHWQDPTAWDKHELSIIGFNDLNQILVTNACQSKKRTQFAIWEDNKFKPIDPAVLEKVYGMNNQGFLLGRKWMTQDGHYVPMLVLYNLIDETVIPVMKDLELMARKLNDQNQIIGVKKHVNGPNKAEGFLWSLDTGFISLRSFLPVAANSKGHLLGFKMSPGNSKLNPTLIYEGEEFDLNQLLDFENSPSAWVRIETVSGINDDGWIIGEGIFDDKEHGFVLIPVNENY